MRCLVTGADGFVGRHLVRHLREASDEVTTITRAAAGDPASVQADVTDRAAVWRAVAETAPQAIYHLAAVSFGPDARRDPSAAAAVTIGGTLHILEAAAAQSDPPAVLIPGSSEVYGEPLDDSPLDERAAVRPVNVYGGTKAAQEVVGLAFGRATDVPVIATRSFNHIGPGQRESFVVPSFASQLAEIALGRRAPKLRVGNLEAVRDFTDVRDVVAAYRLLVAGGHAGEPINVASGRGISIAEILDRLVALSGTSPSIEVDPDRLRPTDPPRIVGDATRLRELTGWRAATPIDATLADVWSDAVARAGEGGA